MVSIYQIGLILAVSVGVLGSALLIAWRDARRDSGRDREVSHHDDRVRRRRRRRKSDGVRSRTF